MAALNKAVDKQSLKGLSPLGKLTPDKIDDIVSKSRVENLPAGRIIFRQGDANTHKIYLLSGQVELSSTGKTRKKVIKSKSVEAKFPIADEIPRNTTAKTKTASSLLYIDASLLEILLDDNPSGEYEVTEIDVADHSTDWMMRFLQSRAFLKLPTENIQKVLMCMEEIHVKNGDRIINQDEEGDYYYIIKKGQCAVTRRPAKKLDEVRLALLAEGDGFGEEALITRGKRNASVKMLEDGTLMRLRKNDFLELLVNPLIRNVHLNSLKTSLYKNKQLIDIRSSEEFKAGSLENAKHIPLSMLRLRIPTLDAGKQFLIYSDNKDDSAAAAFLLAQHGMESHIILGDIKNANKTSIIEKQARPDKIDQIKTEQIDKPANNEPVIHKVTPPVQAIPPTTSVSTVKPTKPEVTPPTVPSSQEKELERLKQQAEQQAQQMLAEAEAIRRSAIEEAEKLKNKLKQEETSRLKSELEITRSKAEAAIQKSEQLAEQIRKQAEQEGSQIRQQAATEAEKLRAEIEALRQQEAEMKLQLESEVLQIRQKTVVQAQKDAELEADKARQAAEEAAKIVKLMAEEEAALTRTNAKKEAEKARQQAIQEAQSTLAAAEQAAIEAQANAEKLTTEARTLELEAEAARKKAEKEAEAIRNAALEDAERIRQSALEESNKIKQESSSNNSSIISHDNIFDLDEELSPTISSQPIMPFVDEASTALEMAKEIREKLLEVEEQRLRNEQQERNKKPKEQVTVTRLKHKTILESEKDVFIFKEPKKQKSYAKTFNDHINTGVFNIGDSPEPQSPPAPTDSQIIFTDGINTNSTFTPASIKPVYEQQEQTKKKRSLFAVAASIFLILSLSLVAYTTKIQINFTEVDALVNKPELELAEEKVKRQARENFRKKLLNAR